MPKSYVVKLPGRSPVTLTAAGFCSPCVAQELQAQTAAVQATYMINVEPAQGDAAWAGPLVFEEQFTGDGRFISRGALTWDDAQFPLPLRWAPEDVGAHGGAQVIGLISTLERRADGSVWGTGIIDTSTELGLKVFHGLQKGTIKGVSADLDSTELEIRLKAELVKEINDSINEMLSGEGDIVDDGPVDIANGEKADENGYVKVAEYSHDDEVMYITSSRFRAATLVDVPAFADAYVALVDPEAVVAGGGFEPSALAMVAAGAPVSPPAAWFEDPALREPTPITITDDGRVFGHAALWGTCHTGFANTCVTPPASRSNYAWFRSGALLTAEGTEIPVGKITLGTGHASTMLAAGPAVAHYDNTGSAVADVAAGEDSHGIWISGSLRSNLSAEELREFRAAPLSGDWRTVGGSLELVAMLAVNMPGFPVPRTKALVAGGATQTLLAPAPIIEVVESEEPVASISPKEFAELLDEVRQLKAAQWAKEVGI